MMNPESSAKPDPEGYFSESEESETSVCIININDNEEFDKISHINEEEDPLKMQSRINEFQCSLCSLPFSCTKQLQAHYCQIHSLNYKSTLKSKSKPKFQCTLCKNVYANKYSLNKHIKKNHTEEKIVLPKRGLDHEKKSMFQCSLCPQIFASLPNLVNHLQDDHVENHKNKPDHGKSILCTLCPESLSTASDLVHHIENNHLKCKYTCPIGICDRSFVSICSCVSHISDTHATNDNSTNDQQGKVHCPLCPKHFCFIGTLHYHLTSVHVAEEKKQLECHVCKNEQKCIKFFDQTCLSKHLKIAHAPLKYKCKVCFLSFRDKSNFNRHKGTHSDLEKFICDKCSQTFAEKAQLKFHLIVKHQDQSIKMTTFKCEWCGKIFLYKCHLEKHVRNHVVEKSVECGICSRVFRDQTELDNHVKNSHASKKIHRYVCDVCSLRFNHKISLVRHLGVKHGRFFDCKKCRRSFKIKVDFDEHFRVVLNSPELQCQICLVSFKTQCSLTVHTESHLKQLDPKVKVKEEKCNDKLKVKLEKPFKCDLCSNAFEMSLYLSLHRKRVHQNCKWQCKSCEKKFDRRSNLVAHERIHSEVRPYVCNICGSSFTRAETLKLHMQVHEEIKRYKCDLCPKSFGTASQLKLHKANYHGGEKPFSCHLCPMAFAVKTELDRHSVVHSNERPFGCDMCSRTFKTSNTLKGHQKAVHQSRKKKLGSRGAVFACSVCSFETNEHKEVAIHNNQHSFPKLILPKMVLCPKHRFQVEGSSIQSFVKREYETVTLNDNCPLCVPIVATKYISNDRHTTQPKYKCSHCLKVFSNSTWLMKHRVGCLNPKDHVCSGCFKKLSKSCNLRRHEKICPAYLALKKKK